MFGIGMPELILILAIALIVIGPKKLPDLAKSLGRAMREFKKATSELKDSIELDSEMKEVKDAFDDIRSDIKESAWEDKPRKKPGAKADLKMTGLEKDYDRWRKDRPNEPAAEEGAGTVSMPEPAVGEKPAETKAPGAEDAPEKDR